MSMILDNSKKVLTIFIPNSEATISAQIKNIKDSEVGGFYTNDKDDIKLQLEEFLGESYEYILDIKSTINLIYSLKELKNEFFDLYKDSMSNIEVSFNYFSSIQNNYIRIPKMYFSGVDNRYFKFDNADPVVKKLRAILYGEITGFNITKYNNQYYVITPFIKENAKNILLKKKDKLINDFEEVIDEKTKEEMVDMQDSFKKWLLENGLMATTVNGYISTIKLTSKEAKEDGVIDKNIFEINNIDEFDKLVEILMTNDKFLKRKENNHNQNTAALNHYREFLSIIKENMICEDKYEKVDFLNDVFIDEYKYDSIISILGKKKNIILEGAPGVGKTFMAKRLAYSIIGKKDKSKVELIQFHQSYSYEDFVEGYRPTESGFELQRGIFYKLSKKALNDPQNNYYLIIDEINRGNLSKIFGELLMLIEADKRDDGLKLAYSEEEFFVPNNLYIIGLMNTADRSLALIDYALRRRFSFIRIEPAFDNEKFIKAFNEKFDNDFSNVITIIKKINDAIKDDKSLGSGFKIGHSYFCPQLKDRKGNKKDIQDIITYEIIPLLEEYWYDDEDSLIQWKNALAEGLND